MLFDGWSGIGRVALGAVVGYAALVALVRVSGKRTLAKLNAFDLVVTVALGSTLSTVVLDRSVALAEGTAALAALVGLQWIVAWATSRSHAVARVVKSEPRVVFFRGEFAREAMRDERLTEDAILAAVRAARIAGLEEVEAVVLESSGDLSVLRRSAGAPPSRRRTLPTPDGRPPARPDQGPAPAP